MSSKCTYDGRFPEPPYQTPADLDDVRDRLNDELARLRGELEEARRDIDRMGGADAETLSAETSKSLLEEVAMARRARDAALERCKVLEADNEVLGNHCLTARRLVSQMLRKLDGLSHDAESARKSYLDSLLDTDASGALSRAAAKAIDVLHRADRERADIVAEEASRAGGGT